MGRSQDALDAFHNSTSLKPTHWNAWNNAIVLLDNLGRNLFQLFSALISVV